VSYYGPAALRWGYANPAKRSIIDSSGILDAYLGGPPQTHGAQYDAASPLSHIGQGAPPTLLINGLRDELVSPFHGEFLSDRLLRANVPHLFLRLPWASHGCDYVFSGPCGQITTYAVERFLSAVL
jgi:acetyl esterase/lipase